MTALENYHYLDLEFAKDGSVVHPDQATAVANLAGTVSDLMVISHGWNNDNDEARRLYESLAESFDKIRSNGGAPGLDGRTMAMVGVLWPSKRFSDSELDAGGAAAIGHADPTLAADLTAMSAEFTADNAATTLHRAAALVPQLESSASAQREYADLLRSLVSPDGAESSDAMKQFFKLDGADLMQRLDAAAFDDMNQLPPMGGNGGAAQAVPMGNLGLGDLGGAANIFGDMWSKGRSLLNFITYYEMKARAGSIGENAVGPFLAQQVVGKTRIHLVGHSFGARLVTAAANAVPAAGSVQSVSLLQAAFSHNAFAKDWEPGRDGGYRHVINAGNVAGPVIITHTRNDKAVGIAYAMASRIAGQNDADIGDKDSPYGGLGSNGAQHTPEADDNEGLGDLGTIYKFQPGRVHNLLADTWVKDHGDVTGPQVANAVLQAVTTMP